MSRSVELADALEMTVAEVMIRAPKTLPADTLVGEVRKMFERPSIRSVLLADGERFAGVIERDGLPAEVPDDAPARPYAQTDVPSVPPAMPMRDAVPLLEGKDEPRLVVLDDDGVTLRGLLCGNPTATGFCVR